MNKILKLLNSKTNITVYNKKFINNLIQNRKNELDLVGDDAYYNHLSTSATEFEKLLNLTKNSYSEFFRNRFTFDVLGKLLVPKLISSKSDKQELRMWSAGCASGQEPYSLAIMLESLNEHVTKKIKYRIFATDNDQSVIEQALIGEYYPEALKNMLVAELSAWFEFDGGKYKINADLKDRIQFELFDLLDDACNCPPSSIFGGFDIIMCCNVLMYYNHETQIKIIEKFRKCLAKGGIVVTGDIERNILLANGYYELVPQSGIFGS